ncbi:MAG: MerR family transcriptional regulator [Acidobacteriota bacterium]
MPDTSAQVEIPDRALFKAVEVCDIVKVQPYVLRSWEAEFPALGVAKTAGGPRVYRRADVEQVARIKHLLLVEGLTLAGARRKLDAEQAPADDEPVLEEAIGHQVRERLAVVKQGLRSILDLLGPDSAEAFHLEPLPPIAQSSARLRAVPDADAKSRRAAAAGPAAAGAKPAAKTAARPKRSA